MNSITPGSPRIQQGASFKKTPSEHLKSTDAKTTSRPSSPNSVAELYFRKSVPVEKVVVTRGSYQSRLDQLDRLEQAGTITDKEHTTHVENLKIDTVKQMVLSLGKLAIETVDQRDERRGALTDMEGRPLEKKDFKGPALDRLNDFSKKINTTNKSELIEGLNNIFINSDGSDHDEVIKDVLRPLFNAIERVGIEIVIPVITRAESLKKVSEKLFSRDSDRFMRGKMTRAAFDKREEAYNNANPPEGVLIDQIVKDLGSIVL